jgi:hypothetical protein
MMRRYHPELTQLVATYRLYDSMVAMHERDAELYEKSPHFNHLVNSATFALQKRQAAIAVWDNIVAAVKNAAGFVYFDNESWLVFVEPREEAQHE